MATASGSAGSSCLPPPPDQKTPSRITRRAAYRRSDGGRRYRPSQPPATQDQCKQSASRLARRAECPAGKPARMPPRPHGEPRTPVASPWPLPAADPGDPAYPHHVRNRKHRYEDWYRSGSVRPPARPARPARAAMCRSRHTRWPSRPAPGRRKQRVFSDAGPATMPHVQKASRSGFPTVCPSTFSQRQAGVPWYTCARFCCFAVLWCRERDSNPYAFRRRILNPLRLPIPPSRPRLA